MPTRRRVLQALGLAGLTGTGWGIFGPARANAYYQGPLSDHFDGVRFFNPDQPGPRGGLAFLRWQFGERGVAWPSAFASSAPADRPPQAFDDVGFRMSYVGHASFLVQSQGKAVLIDPVWSDRASPFSFVGPKRVNPPGIAFDDLPRIDAVLITHNHYDHMDTATIGRLWQRNRPRIVTPLGNDTVLKSEIPGIEAETVDWDATVDLGDGMSVHVEPTMHWSARGTRDRSHALWASFVIEAGHRKLYCVGDSGFGDGRTFRRVAERHPNLAAALLPIGAYEPRWFMINSHMNPDDAIKALRLCGAPIAFGHHWGTFRLTNEAIDQPAKDLTAALATHGLAEDRFTALHPGDVRIVP
jgi:L-ascorbate metabolism protein UlaG (beta-lactamase superfamily)